MKKIIFALYMMIIPFALFAQDKATDEEAVSSAFVSRLRAVAKDSAINLTWKNSSTVSANLLVYKYSEVIDEDNFSNAELLATLAPDKESYKYSPREKEEYFFSVQYALPSGEANGLFIQYRNITTKGVKIESLGTEEELATKITDISAMAGTDSITINFNMTHTDRDLMIFRSTTPILKEDDLLNSNSPTALDAGTRKYTDYPIPGIDYYYAVLDAGLVKIGVIELSPGHNTMATPVTIPLAADHEAKLPHYSQKSLPLPLLALNRNIESGNMLINSATIMLPAKREISKKARMAIDILLETIKTPSLKKKDVHILKIDTVENTIGEEYTLQQIISNYIKKKDFVKGKEAILDFMRIKHDKDVTARAHFYLGQIYYFSEDYESAFLEFLLASEEYYYDVQSWIDTCFDHLVEK